jgi:hypothetical protein
MLSEMMLFVIVGEAPYQQPMPAPPSQSKPISLPVIILFLIVGDDPRQQMPAPVVWNPFVIVRPSRMEFSSSLLRK